MYTHILLRKQLSDQKLLSDSDLSKWVTHSSHTYTQLLRSNRNVLSTQKKNVQLPMLYSAYVGYYY